eukprot:scaffold206087_cov19-Prasinocladus_malaysianus.AAC.2
MAAFVRPSIYNHQLSIRPYIGRIMLAIVALVNHLRGPPASFVAENPLLVQCKEGSIEPRQCPYTTRKVST